MSVAEFTIDFLSKKGIRAVFMVTGGQAMFLNDALYGNKKIKTIFTHHEQAASMAAEGYGRIKGTPAVAMVTAGPGGINALNGVVGGFVDSSPMIVISGQSNSSVAKYMKENPIRQHGTQGLDIESFVSKATKYFQTIDDPAKILYYLEKAYYIATTGRTGPVWLNFPLDIQRTIVPNNLKKYNPKKETKNFTKLEKDVDKVLDLLKKSKRPLVVAGHGIKIAKAEEEFDKFIQKTKPLVMTTRLGIDLIDSSSSLFSGRPGLFGDRYANIGVQNADLIIVIGARMDIGITGYDPGNWGQNAKIVYVDIDPEEIKKPGIKIDLKIRADAHDFLKNLNKKITVISLPSFSNWIKTNNKLRDKYPTVLPSYKNERLVNSYYFTERLSEQSSKDDIIVVDTSSPFHVVCQAWKIKKGQVFLTTGGISTMGYWPAGIGASMTDLNKRTIVITGDGSLQMNLQELATLKQNNLPVKLFVINNNGYLLIRNTQKTHLGERYMGESPKTGLFIPDSIELAKVYGIKSVRINNTKELDRKLKEVLSYKGPVICDVMSPEWQLIEPRISSKKMPDGRMVSRPYEDMSPFLSEEELKSNMIVNNNEK